MKKGMLICILLAFTLLVSVAHAEVMDETSVISTKTTTVDRALYYEKNGLK